MNNKQFAALSWQLLEAKVIYYYIEYHSKAISDAQYDLLEQQYLRACVELGLPNMISHHKLHNSDIQPTGEGMMEIDLTRPSVQLVINKLLTTV